MSKKPQKKIDLLKKSVASLLWLFAVLMSLFSLSFSCYAERKAEIVKQEQLLRTSKVAIIESLADQVNLINDKLNDRHLFMTESRDKFEAIEAQIKDRFPARVHRNWADKANQQTGLKLPYADSVPFGKSTPITVPN